MYTLVSVHDPESDFLFIESFVEVMRPVSLLLKISNVKNTFKQVERLEDISSFLKPKQALDATKDADLLLISVPKAVDFYSGDVGSAEQFMEEIKSLIAVISFHKSILLSKGNFVF